MSDEPLPPPPATPNAVTEPAIGDLGAAPAANGEQAPISGHSRSWSGPPPPPDTDTLLGTTLRQSYTVERIVGEGGMGRVYEAKHTRIRGKRFAVKVLHAEFLRQPEVRTRFHREAEAAALIDHPNVVGVYDVDETKDGRPYLVAEFLEGEELGDLLDKDGKLSVARTVRVARQVCRALAAAHARGVVHRDIKPENVFLTGAPQRPSVKVLDFGISRLEDKSARTLTKTGMVMGTPAYMSPEQARGERVDHRTDIYAVGAIMYRALTGRLPFEKDDPGATVIAVLTEEPTRPRVLDPQIPEPLELIIQQAMAKAPDERFQAMEELDEALAPYDLDDTTPEPASSLPAAAGSSPHAATGVRARVGTVAAKTTLGQQALAIRTARPMVVALLALAVATLLVGLVSAISAIIRLSRGGIGAEVTFTETLLVLVAVLCALTTPAVLLIRHVRKKHWDNTARVLALQQGLTGPIVVGVGTYGVTALLLRLSETALLGHAVGLAWPAWDILLFFVALLAAGAVVGTRWMEQRETAAGPAWDRMMSLGTGAVVLVLLLGGVLAIRGAQSLGTLSSAPPDEAAGGAAAVASTTPGGSAAITSRPSATPAPIKPSAPVALGMEQRKLVGQMRMQIGRGQMDKAVATLRQLLELTPRAAEDAELRTQIETLTIRALLLPNRPEGGQMLELLSSGMGTAGIDILYHMYTTRGGTVAAKEAAALLANPKIRARGTAQLRIAWDLRAAKKCEDKLALMDRAVREGDRRAVNELRIMSSCRRRSQGSCCLPNDKRVKQAIKTIEARL
ncbi:MAG: serine/threonine protein kinase [Deltaproteobacteria bacterium]|jgi:serine/threonine-protein kinase|nr:serine/threonine protein kinase [Deltaproteobacteria bacterium]MBW2534267.1 serine/threonine protein kinase [Deltaproteobacteria bacterium]